MLLLGAGRGRCGAAVKPSVLFFRLKRTRKQTEWDYESEETLLSAGVVTSGHAVFIYLCLPIVAMALHWGSHIYMHHLFLKRNRLCEIIESH